MIVINYNDLLANKEEFLLYAFKRASSFGLSFAALKPYGENKRFTNEKLELILRDHMLAQYLPGDGFVNRIIKKTVVNVYPCNKKTRDFVIGLGNNFAYPNDNAEDIFFMNSGELWFESVYHEELAWIYAPTNEDITFLLKNRIAYK